MQQLRASRVFPVVFLLILTSSAQAQENATTLVASPEPDATGSNNSVAVEPVDSPALSPNITDTDAGNETGVAAAPLGSSLEPMDATNSTAVPAAPQLARVDQVLPFFKGVRSCLPFNILIAAPQGPGPWAQHQQPEDQRRKGGRSERHQRHRQQPRVHRRRVGGTRPPGRC